jgi:hypothetical protein
LVVSQIILWSSKRNAGEPTKQEKPAGMNGGLFHLRA